MEIKNQKVMCLVGLLGALATGCTVSVRAPEVEVAPPPPAVVTVGVPDSYVWDGYEYVGVVGDRYMYLGPGGVWLDFDAGRRDRFRGWERGHPDWRRNGIRNSGRDARGRPARREERRDDRR